MVVGIVKVAGVQYAVLKGREEKAVQPLPQRADEGLPLGRIGVPGGQGVTPLEFDCRQCGECYLNLTGGICPLTACSKGLVNGQCGGAKDGKCEVDPDMECGWERIQRRLAMVGRLDALRSPVQIRDYNNEVKAK